MRLLPLVAALLVALTLAASAAADVIVLPDDASLPWTDPAHQSPTEVLAASVASHISGRAVTVRCEGDNDWHILALQGGFNPAFELGYVTAWYHGNGTVARIETFTEITGSVCLRLKEFGIAATKPTKCAPLVETQHTEYRNKRVAVRKRVKVHGKWVVRTVYVTKRVAVVVTGSAPGPPAPCYVTGGKAIAEEPPAYWQAYDQYAQALLTLAHESIHLGGVVGARLSNGIYAGDQLAEAKAQCYGMQWLPYTAQRFGASPDDALAIAQYTYEQVYPRYHGTPYWSPDCRPGGGLDIRAAGSTAWP